jgi:hypothetical protein
VPLPFLWDGTTVLLATPASSPTGRNLQANNTVRLGIGPTRDVVLIEGTVRVLAIREVSQQLGDVFAVKTGFDPRQETGTYLYFRVTLQRLQAWREANELDGRDLMRDGRWLVE